MTQRAGSWQNGEMQGSCKNGEHGTPEDEEVEDPTSGFITVTTTAGEYANGNGGLVFDTTQSSASVDRKWPIFFLPNEPLLMVVHGFTKLSADIAAGKTVTLWTEGVSGRQIRINDDKRMEIYNQQVPADLLNTPANSVLFSTSAFVEWYVFFDGKTDSNDVMIWVVEGGTEKEAFLSGKTWGNIFSVATGVEAGFGDPGTPAGGVGCKLFMDDIQMRRSNVAADSPDLLAYPRLKSAGGESYLPKAAGNKNEWNGTFVDIDDLGAHDGDATRIDINLLNKRQNWKSTDANPIPSSPTPTIEAVHFYCVGKLLAGDKEASQWIHEIHGAEVKSGAAQQGSQSYEHRRWLDAAHKASPVDRLWHHADFDANTLIWGSITESIDLSTNVAVTKLPGPTIIYHTAHLPLLTARPSAAATLPRIMMF